MAILSSADFDAFSVDQGAITFGRTGDEHSLTSCYLNGVDVNRDGRPDLLCQFDTQLTAFRQGDSVAILKGKTKAAVQFSGSGPVQVIH